MMEDLHAYKVAFRVYMKAMDALVDAVGDGDATIVFEYLIDFHTEEARRVYDAHPADLANERMSNLRDDIQSIIDEGVLDNPTSPRQIDKLWTMVLEFNTSLYEKAQEHEA